MSTSTYTTPPAANPHPRLRPGRYGIAIAIAVVVVITLVVSSLLNYVYLDTIPGRTSLYGLLAVALITLGTYIGVRAFTRDRASRRKHLIRAGVLLGLGTLLWLLVIDIFVFTQSAGPVVAAICAIACLPTTAFGLFVVRRMDRNEKEPWRLVLVAAAWGAIVATSLVIWGETIWEQTAQRTLVPGPGLDASTAFSAGLLEELAKGLAVVLLFLVMRNDFDDVVDGIVYGAAVGLGFNFLESIAYMTNLYAIFSPEGYGWYAAGLQWYGRQVLGLFFGHATYTAFIGAGLGIARQLRNKRQKALAILSGFLVAIAAHFSWDAWVTFFPIENTIFGLVEIHLRTLIMTGPFTAALIALLIFGIRYESMGLVDQFRKEAATGSGAILPEEVPTLASPWRRLKQRLHAFQRGGLRAYLEVGRLQSAQLDLAMERWHRERQEIDTPLEAEDTLRRRVMQLRHWVPAA
ncbi:MAG TPA: PrsW family intramembrane metalloprotease [Candidatus Dormibacteraeota bacterium]|nr:PrsW family intramembrane metalloprotease [Candidatus Dormibacteraeota bacterium]